MDPGTLTNQDSMESSKVFFVAHLFIDFSHKYLCVLTMHLVESSVVRCSSSGDFFTKTMKVATNFMVGMSFMILKGFIIIPKVVLNLCKSWICSSWIFDFQLSTILANHVWNGETFVILFFFANTEESQN